MLGKFMQSVAAERITSLQLPEWVDCDCPICGKLATRQMLQGVEVSFVPSSLGDIVFTYLCSHCDAMFIMHLQSNVESLDIGAILTQSTNTTLINRDDLFKSHHHNIIATGKINEYVDGKDYTRK